LLKGFSKTDHPVGFWKKISKVEIVLIAILLIAGCAYIIFTPLGAGYDEDQHLIRVWQMSDFVMIPQRMSAKTAKFPQVFFDLSYRLQPLVEPVPLNFWQDNAGLKLYDRGYYYGATWTRSGYTPALLFPQAMVMRYLGRKYDFPVLFVYYGCRFAGLLSYMILAWFALRLIPYSKWLFLLLMLSPTAIYQAATISADSISNGIGFLFIAGCLALNEKKELERGDTLSLTLLIIALFLTKVNLVPLVLLPFILIHPGRYKGKYTYVSIVFFTVLFFLIEVVGWNLIALSNMRFVVSEGVSFSGQLSHVISNPFAFLKVLFNELSIHSVVYIQQWIGVYGYDYGNVPILTYVVYLFGVGLALFQNGGDRQPNKRTRIILAVFFILIYITTMSIFYITVTAVGEQFVYGVQGRYFTPVAPLLFLSLSGLSFKRSIYPAAQMILCSAAPVIYFIGLYFSFHMICGSTYYTRNICYQPVYKNYSPLLRSTSLISDDLTLTQEIVPVCDGLTLVQTRVNSAGPKLIGKTKFTIRDETLGVIAAENTIENSKLPEDDWYIIRFQPDWSSAGKLYTLTIQGVEGFSTNGPLLALSLKPEYPYGTLYENGNVVEDDIIFQYGCITGLEKLFGKEN